MPKAKDKGFVDLHSIHSKLADGYKIYENDIDDESDNIRDFKSVSESIEKLELIVEKLESGEIGLEESVRLYEEGMKIKKICDNKLKDIEMQIKKIMISSGLEPEEIFL